MARWATQAIFGGVDFSGCRVELVDAGGFKSLNAGSVDWGNTGLPHVQTVNRGVRGIQFGTKIASCLIADLVNVFNAITTAEATQSTIRLQIVDGAITIDSDGTPDYSIPEWWTYEKQSEGYYEGIVLRWISKEAHS